MMDQDQALVLAQRIWGSNGFANVSRRHLGTEKPGADGWIRAEGPIHCWNVGYYRRGKKGAKLSTVFGGYDGFESAFAEAQKRLEGTKIGQKLNAVLAA